MQNVKLDAQCCFLVYFFVHLFTKCDMYVFHVARSVNITLSVIRGGKRY